MSFLGFRKYPTPVLKPIAPFIVGAAIVWYGVAKAQSAGVYSETYAKDPRNPYISSAAKANAAH